jgi:hypothetical protein
MARHTRLFVGMIMSLVGWREKGMVRPVKSTFRKYAFLGKGLTHWKYGALAASAMFLK